MEGAYLGFLWISPEVVGSMVWSQACECATKGLFHLLKGLLLCGNAQIIGGVGMNRLVIYIYNSVVTCRYIIINTSAIVSRNAKKIGVKKVSDVDVSTVRPEL